MNTGRRDTQYTHDYILDGEVVPGVTTILSEGIPKPALVGWAARTAAEYAYDNAESLVYFTRDEAVNKTKKAHIRDSRKAAERGSEVHRICELLNRGVPISDIPSECAGYIRSYQQFLDDWQPRFVAIEKSCFSRKHRYAGTFDFICHIDHYDKTWMCDIKTSRSGPWPETALQLAAYANAEFYIDGETEVPMPKIHAGFIVWLSPERYCLYQVRLSPVEFDTFRAAQQVAYWRSFPEGGVITPPWRPPR